MVAVALCSTKGGSGKTTLAFNLMERAVASGLRAVLVDCDYQEASIGLALLREPEDPLAVVAGSVSVAGAERLRWLRDSGEYDLVLCDLPGSQNMTLGSILSEMDLVLSPVGVGATDLMAAANIWRLVQDLENPVRLVFVLNHYPRGRWRFSQVVESLERRGAEVCPVGLQHRVIHLDTFYEGLGVCEKDPDSAASSEVNSLWSWLCENAGIVLTKNGGSDAST